MDGVCRVYTNTNTRLGQHVLERALPPLGLAYLAAVLEREGYRVGNVDANALWLSREELEGHPELDALTRRSS